MLKSIELPTVAVVRSRGASPMREPLPERLTALLDPADLDAELDGQVGLEKHLIQLARDLASTAYPANRTTHRHTDPWIDHAARSDFHRALLILYKQHVH